jgi:outer membrane cobalamin receptor
MMKMNTKQLGWVAVITAFAPLQGWAQAVQPSPRTLDAVVVTATGQQSAVRDVQASVEVVDRERLDRFADGSVAQALKHAAGVQASSGGATGDISIRGFNRTHTLVLVDGMRRTNNYGSNNPGQIGYFDIERIEIVRGPLSSLYGSEALGGVVNVITRHPGTNPGTDVMVTMGSADGGRETLQTGVNHRTGDAQLGHSLTVEQNYRGSLRHHDSIDDDFGRLNNWSGSYRGRWAPDTTQSLAWAVEVFDRDSEADYGDTDANRHTRFEDERRYFGSMNYVREVGPGELTMRVSHGQSKGSTNRSHPDVETTDFKQQQADAVYQFYPHPEHAVSLGAGALRDDLDVSINSRSAQRVSRFVLAQDQWQLHPDWQLVAGVRMDRFDDFGTTTNPRISLGWQSGGWGARLGYGTAFRAPSLLEQYSSFVRGRLLIRGNPDLDPEKSDTWEAMVRREFAHGHVELTLHRNEVDDLIESFTTQEMSGRLRVVEYRNIKRARIDGAELAASWRLNAGWSLDAGVDLIDARDAATDERLEGRARQTWRLESRYETGAWAYSLRARHLVDYLATGIDAPRGSAPYNTDLTRVDLSVRYTYRPDITLIAGIDNLFDQRDADNYSVTSGGTQRNDPDARYAYVGARMTF